MRWISILQYRKYKPKMLKCFVVKCCRLPILIDFYQQTGAKDKSLRLYAGVNHFLMNDPKGHHIASDIINWIDDRLGNEVYEDAGI